MKKRFAFLLIIVFLVSGCSFDVQLVTPAPVTETPPLETQITLSLVVTLPVMTETPVPGFTPTTSDPVFYGAYVASAQTGSPSQIRFPAGTKQIFALWNYQNMRAGLAIKREWYLNGELWLEREEAWDFAKYGERGALPDISIYDFEIGLPAGVYQLMIYIDGVRQPIGSRVTDGGADPFIEFEIMPPIEAKSPNSGWTVRADLGRLILFDTSGGQVDLFTGREIATVAWFPDSQHLLIVDRDRSKQVAANLSVGVRDDLWIVDISSLKMDLVHASDTQVSGNTGLVVSPDGRYIASIEGSGFGDACFLDAKQVFFEVARDFTSVKMIKQDQFAGVPKTADGMMYPVSVGSWQGNTQYLVPLNGTCGSFDPALIGTYLFDVPGLRAELQPASATPFSVGDLGWGEVHGIVTDSVTGKAIAGATVTCEHSSYTSPAKCSGSAVTSTPGIFIFEKIFFHDMDTIKLTVTAPGYQPQEFTQTAFTTNDLMAIFSLTPLP